MTSKYAGKEDECDQQARQAQSRLSSSVTESRNDMTVRGWAAYGRLTHVAKQMHIWLDLGDARGEVVRAAGLFGRDATTRSVGGLDGAVRMAHVEVRSAPDSI